MSFRRFAVSFFLIVLFVNAVHAEDSQIHDRAASLLRQARYGEVIQLVELARKSRNATPEDLLILSVAYFNTDQTDEAMSVLDEAEALDPENPQIQLAIGSMALQNGALGEAVRRFRHAYTADPLNDVASQVLVSALINFAAELANQGDIEGAYKALDEAVSIDPSSFIALRNLAVLAYQSDDMADAADFADRALVINPEDEDLYKIRIEALRGSDTPQRLVDALNAYLNRNPTDAAAHALLGRTYHRLGRTEREYDAYAEAERLGTDDPVVYDRLAAAQPDTSDQSRRRSLSLTHMAIGQAIQAISRLKLSAAGALKNRELTDLTEEDWQRLDEMSRTLNEPLSVLNRSLERLRILHENPAELEADLLRLVDWYPSSVELTSSLGTFYEDENRWDDAYEVWRGIALNDPNQAVAHLGMAKALLERGDVIGAKLASRRAFEVDAESPEVYTVLAKSYGDERTDLRELLLERSRRDSQNPLLFDELANIEETLHMVDEAEKHRERADVLRNW